MWISPDSDTRWGNVEHMADFSEILASRPDLDNYDREWLHQLVADWQVIADLSFADLLLIVQNGDGRYIIAEQCLSLIHI